MNLSLKHDLHHVGLRKLSLDLQTGQQAPLPAKQSHHLPTPRPAFKSRPWGDNSMACVTHVCTLHPHTTAQQTPHNKICTPSQVLNSRAQENSCPFSSVDHWPMSQSWNRLYEAQLEHLRRLHVESWDVGKAKGMWAWLMILALIYATPSIEWSWWFGAEDMEKILGDSKFTSEILMMKIPPQIWGKCLICVPCSYFLLSPPPHPPTPLTRGEGMALHFHQFLFPTTTGAHCTIHTSLGSTSLLRLHENFLLWIRNTQRHEEQMMIHCDRLFRILDLFFPQVSHAHQLISLPDNSWAISCFHGQIPFGSHSTWSLFFQSLAQWVLKLIHVVAIWFRMSK